MSLQRKWEEYSRDIIFINEADKYSAQRAFCAGAQATLDEVGLSVTAQHEIQAEIDHFKAGKP